MILLLVIQDHIAVVAEKLDIQIRFTLNCYNS
jgi:hypothetical protein